MSGKDTILCVMTKAPRRGQVKTRLAASIGETVSLALAAAFIEDSIAAAFRFSAADLVLVLSGSADDLPDAARSLPCWRQADGDLGHRLEACVERALQESRKVIVIGSDSPGLPVERLHAARLLLDRHSAVLGPADDGGFYLIGFSAWAPGALQEIPWSSAHTKERTLERLARYGHDTALLPPWFDVDELADLRRLAALVRSGEVVAPATARILDHCSQYV